jgi:hypothetical protein
LAFKASHDKKAQVKVILMMHHLHSWWERPPRC